MSKLKRISEVGESMKALGYGNMKNPVGLGDQRRIAEGPRKTREDILSGIRPPNRKDKKSTS